MGYVCMNVKSAVVFTLFVLLVPTLASSAVEIDSIGVKAGVTVSQMRHSSYRGSSESVTGFVGGPFVNVAVSNSIVIQPSVIYAQRGGVYHDLSDMLWGGLAEVDELTISRDYLELPLLLRYNFQSNDLVSPSLVFGPVGSWVLASEILEDGVPYPDESGEFDISVLLGLGLMRKFDGVEFSLDISYRRALTGSGYSDFKADGIDLMLGVGF